MIPKSLFLYSIIQIVCLNVLYTQENYKVDAELFDAWNSYIRSFKNNDLKTAVNLLASGTIKEMIKLKEIAVHKENNRIYNEYLAIFLRSNYSFKDLDKDSGKDIYEYLFKQGLLLPLKIEGIHLLGNFTGVGDDVCWGTLYYGNKENIKNASFASRDLIIIQFTKEQGNWRVNHKGIFDLINIQLKKYQQTNEVSQEDVLTYLAKRREGLFDY